MEKGHLCHGYIINPTFIWVVSKKSTKKYKVKNDLVFHWCLYNKENITWNFSPCVEKYFSVNKEKILYLCVTIIISSIYSPIHLFSNIYHIKVRSTGVMMKVAALIIIISCEMFRPSCILKSLPTCLVINDFCSLTT